MLINTLSKLTDEYQEYIIQIKAGLLKGVLSGMGDIPNYIGFTYNPRVYKKFYKPKGINFKISNVRTKDIKTGHSVKLSFYFSYGVINGYSVDEVSAKLRLSTSEIDVSGYRVEIVGNNDYDQIIRLLSLNEVKLVNRVDVYVSNIKGKDYYHLKELDDGDFIGLDLENNLYKITHDPFEIILQDRSKFEQILQN